MRQRIVTMSKYFHVIL